MRGNRSWRGAAAGLLAAAAVAGAVGALSAPTEAKTDSRIYALRKKPILGRTPADWTVEWWQWVFSLPVSVHPLFDETGALVEVGQRGPVWFLGGIYNVSGAAVRTATIPAGKALLFPVINVEVDNIGRENPFSPAALQAEAASILANVDPSTLFAVVDGNPLPVASISRIVSPLAPYPMPEDNVQKATGLPAVRGIYEPWACDGWWVMLRALPVGEHTLHFGGTIGAPYNFTLDIQYFLTVVESNRP